MVANAPSGEINIHYREGRVVPASRFASDYDADSGAADRLLTGDLDGNGADEIFGLYQLRSS